MSSAIPFPLRLQWERELFRPAVWCKRSCSILARAFEGTRRHVTRWRWRFGVFTQVCLWLDGGGVLRSNARLELNRRIRKKVQIRSEQLA